MGNLSPPRRLIVNADDFGRSRSINAAVIGAQRDGTLTTASLMVTDPASEVALSLEPAGVRHRDRERLGLRPEPPAADAGSVLVPRAPGRWSLAFSRRTCLPLSRSCRPGASRVAPRRDQTPPRGVRPVAERAGG